MKKIVMVGQIWGKENTAYVSTEAGFAEGKKIGNDNVVVHGYQTDYRKNLYSAMNFIKEVLK